MANSFISSNKYKIEEIDIFIQAIEEGFVEGTTKEVVQSKINYLRRQTQSEYIMNLIARLNLIKRRCKR